MLPEIVAAVGGKARIIVDGGSDVVKAMILDAEPVSIGWLCAYGLATAGAPGMVRLCEILKDEMSLPRQSYIRPARPFSLRPDGAL